MITLLTPLGGYPGDDDRGRELQAKRDAEEMIEDFIAAAHWLKNHSLASGKVGVVGFCYGGGVANTLAVRIPDVITAAVPFYGRQPAAVEVPKIKAPLLIHYAEHDPRINAGWPAFEQALTEARGRGRGRRTSNLRLKVHFAKRSANEHPRIL